MPRLSLLELLVLCCVTTLCDDCNVTAPSALRVVLPTAVRSLPVAVSELSCPAPVAATVRLPPAFSWLPTAVLLACVLALLLSS